MAFDLSFTRRDEDVAAASRAMTGACVRSWVHWFFVGVVFVGTVGSYVAARELAPDGGSIFGVVAAVMTFSVLSLIRGRLEGLARTRLGRRVDAQLDGPGMRETKVEADESGVRMSAGGQDTRFEWTAFSAIIEARDSVILVAGGVGHIVPTRAFDDPQAKADFIDFVRAHAPHLAN